MNMKLTLGSRGSKLALAQTHWIKAQLLKYHPQLEIDIQIIVTKGDAIQDIALDKIGDKGLFVKEIEQALLDGAIDLAIHSLKDMPTTVTSGLMFLPAVLRADARDALISKVPLKSVMDLPQGAIIGTGSKRRAFQLLSLRPDFQIKGIRGNVDTRLRKLVEEDYDAIVLAQAGLDRLGLKPEGLLTLSPEEMLPAPAQGLLGLQVRSGDERLELLAESLLDEEAQLQMLAERGFLGRLGGGCHMPVGAWTTIDATGMTLTGLIGDEAGTKLVKDTVFSALPSYETAGRLGLRLAESLEAKLEAALVNMPVITTPGNPLAKPYQAPRVFLVGAGCGDPQLMTLKGKALLELCDAVVYDRLANPKFLSWVPKTATRVYVGKAAANHAMVQEDINQTLVNLGSTHHCVVRLKGGDPYVFGRGGEEGEALFDAGIPFEVVPGITSAIGGLGYAGIPVTHRDYASSFHVITGHLRKDNPTSEDGSDETKSLDWPAIAKYEGTLVFLMGLGSLAKITESLIENGKNPETPAALVSWASHLRQRKLSGTLATLAKLQEENPVSSPAIIVVGHVVLAQDKLDWFTTRPLFGQTIGVTRAREQASSLVNQLENLGANVLEFPTIEIESRGHEALNHRINRLPEYSHLCFTSANGVRRFFEQLDEQGKDARSLGHLTIIAIGSATAQALKSKGIIADLMPEEFVTESLIEVLTPVLEPHHNLLLPRAIHARPELITALKGICNVDEVQVYEAVAAPLDPAVISGLDKVGLITFTSASTVKHFFESLGDQAYVLLKTATALVIGPVTRGALDAYGTFNVIQAKSHTVESMVDTLIETLN